MKKKSVLTIILSSLIFSGCANSSSVTSSTTPVIIVDSNSFVIGVGNTKTIKASESDVIFASDNDEIATVNQEGVVTGVALGTATITLSKDGFEDVKVSIIVENFKDLTGDYVGKIGTISVNSEGAILNGTSLKEGDVVKETIDGEICEVTYLIGDNENYRIYYEGTDRFLLALEQKQAESYVKLAEMMPTIEEFNGAYSFDGSSDKWNTILQIGNYYNDHYDAFYVGLFSNSMNTLRNDTHYLKSFKTLVNGELRTAIGLYDYVDDYEYGTYIFQNKPLIGLYDYVNDVFDYFHDPLFLDAPLFASEDKKMYLTFDKENYKVINQDVEYSYKSSYVEGKGHVVELTNGDEKIEVTPTPFGCLWNEKDTVTEYVCDDISLLEEIEFHSENMTFKYAFNFGSMKYGVKINNRNVDYTFEVYNHRKSLKVNLDGKDYYFSVFKDNIAVLCTTLDGYIYFINNKLFVDVYNRTFINRVNGITKTLIVDNQFNVTFEGQTVASKLIYEPLVDYPYLKFDVNGKTYRYKLLENGIAGFVLTYDDKEEYYFDKPVIEQFYNTYTDKSSPSLVLGEEKINYFGKEYNYSIEPYYIESSFAYVLSIKFLAGEDEVFMIASASMLTTYVEDEKGTLISDKSFIPVAEFKKLIGTYYYNGKYGPEKFRLTSDGHFYADTEIENGLEEREYDYHLYMMNHNNKLVPVIGFVNKTETSDLIILLYKDGHKVVCFGLNYVSDYLFNFNGYYTSSSQDSIISLEDDCLYVDGAEAEIKDISYDNNSTTIIAVVNFETKTYKFEKDGQTSKVIVSDGTNEIVYEKMDVDIDIDSLTGDYETLYGDVNLSKKGTDYLLTFMGHEETSYRLIIWEGFLAVKFTVLAYDIIIYNNGTENICVIDTDVPPPPPLNV